MVNKVREIARVHVGYDLWVLGITLDFKMNEAESHKNP